MKGAVLALFCTVALASAEINENGCPVNPYIDILQPHPNCNKYYQCVQGDLIERKCASTTVFNFETQECDWSENVDCGNRNPVVTDSSEDSGNDSNEDDNGNEDHGTGEDNGTREDSNSSSDSGNEDSDCNGGDENGNPSEAAKICAVEDSDGVLVAHENCNQFYKCSDGVPVALNCYGNLLYNPATDQCDWPENVNCVDRNTEDENSSNGDNGNGGNENGDNVNGDNDNGNNGGGGNGNPSKVTEICAAEGSNGILVAHEDCNQFYTCSDGVPVELKCYGNLLFNPKTDQCDWPEKVNCEDRNTEGGNNDNGDNGNGENDNGDNDSGHNEGGGNSDPSEAPEICAAEGSNGVLVAHENCNQFYKCSEGKPVALECNSILLFNPANDQCDWPENVNCGSRNRFTSFNKHLRFRM